MSYYLPCVLFRLRRDDTLTESGDVIAEYLTEKVLSPVGWLVLANLLLAVKGTDPATFPIKRINRQFCVLDEFANRNLVDTLSSRLQIGVLLGQIIQPRG